MDKKIPMRKCIGCGESKGKRELARIVKNAAGDIYTDTTGKADGRGAYVCKNKACVEKAFNNKGLERAFKTKIPLDVIEKLKKEFEIFE